MIREPAPKSRSESNDLQYASFWLECFETVNSDLTDLEFRKAVSPITIRAFLNNYKQCRNSKINSFFDLVFASESLELNDRSHEFESIEAIPA